MGDLVEIAETAFAVIGLFAVVLAIYLARLWWSDNAWRRQRCPTCRHRAAYHTTVCWHQPCDCRTALNDFVEGVRWR